MRVAGIMSGTSGDGLDVAICTFYPENDSIKHNLEHAFTFPFPEELEVGLSTAHLLDGFSLAKLDKDFGKFIANCVNDTGYNIDLISSHGHTVFHEPNKGLTLQIGCGATIAAISEIPVICDFRTTDVALGGQGAPLVPVGDEMLFGENDACLNLGGICNISFRSEGVRIACDISFCNLILNYLAKIEGKPFDENGEMAKSGTIIPELFQKLNSLAFYKTHPPKSLGREWVDKEVIPILSEFVNPTADLLHTSCRHIAQQIGTIVNAHMVQNMLVTGGGAFNKTLIQEIERSCKCNVVVPSTTVVCFKEATIFGLLGYLRWHERMNVWSSVTGSTKDSSSGAIYLP